jgi:hypothetical protein
MRWSGNLEEEEKQEDTTHAPRPFTAQAHHMRGWKSRITSL